MFLIGFFIGLVIFAAEAKVRVAPNEDQKRFDWQNSVLYFWVIGPTGFIVAVATVFNKQEVNKHWFQGLNWEVPVLKAVTNLAFGISAGILMCLVSMFACRARRGVREYFVVLKSFLDSLWRRLSRPKELSGSWDRFDPNSQVKYLKGFLAHIPNKTDQDSLQFWEARVNDTEGGGFNFRGSFGAEELSKLNLSFLRGLSYWSMEFWKDKTGNFRIRHTKDSDDSPKKYRDATEDETCALEPYVRDWYKVLRR